MRTVFLAAALGLFFFLGAANALAASHTNGIAPDNAPFTYLDSSGNPAGFDVEAMNWIARAMGFSLSHKPLAPDALLPGLLAGDVDMVCSGLRITPEALQQAAFSRPYCITGSVFAVRDGSGLSRADVMTGNTVIGVQRATPQAQWLARQYTEGKGNYTLQYYDYTPEIFADLLAGKLGAAAVIAEQAEEAIHLEGKPLIIAGEFGPSDFLGVAVRPGDTALAALIDEGFRKLKADPFWKELQARHRVSGW